MRPGTRIKGFKVHQDGRGKVTLERIAFYGRDSSAKIRARKSKKATPVRQGVLGLHWKGEK
jgi:hypothetical protein